MAAIILMICPVISQIVEIPDTAFLSALIEEGVDTDEDSQISRAEAETVTVLDISYKEISGLSGIEAFVNLKHLDCKHNRITDLDLSGCSVLTDLYCNSNKISSLDVSGCTGLIQLHCGHNQLTNLDVSRCHEITHLVCNSNLLTSLDLTGNPWVKLLYCSDNLLTDLDISNNVYIGSIQGDKFDLSIGDMPTLSEVCVWTTPFPPEGVIVNTTGSPNIIFTSDCSTDNKRIVSIPDPAFLQALIEKGVDSSGDGLISYDEAEDVSSLNVSGKGIQDITGIAAFINLNSLSCQQNELTSLDIPGSPLLTDLVCAENHLTNLDFTGCGALNSVICSDNQLTSLDLSGCPDLTIFYCDGNLLTSLNVSVCTALIDLNCSRNLFTSLDVSNNLSLVSLGCSYNQLNSLNLGNNSSLRLLVCIGNQLTNLDVSGNSALEYLRCSENRLTSLDLSGCPGLIELACGNNQITALDLSGNMNLTEMNLSNMDELMKVCVWTDPFPPEGVRVDKDGSPNIIYTTECNDFQSPELTIGETSYSGEIVEAISSEDGMIYLVPEQTEKELASIRKSALDSLAVQADAPVMVTLKGLEYGVYWLYARDLIYNISEPAEVSVMGVGIHYSLADQFRICPNPTHGLLTIIRHHSDLTVIEIKSLNGQLIYQQEMAETQCQIDLSSFQKGFYIITIRSKNFVTTRKIIKL